MVLHRYKQSLKRLFRWKTKSASLLLKSVAYDRCSRRTVSHGRAATTVRDSAGVTSQHFDIALSLRLWHVLRHAAAGRSSFSGTCAAGPAACPAPGLPQRRAAAAPDGTPAQPAGAWQPPPALPSPVRRPAAGLLRSPDPVPAAHRGPEGLWRKAGPAPPGTLHHRRCAAGL